MYQPLLIALIAAVGNAIFVFGQKKASGSDSVSFMAVTAGVGSLCLLFYALASQQSLIGNLRHNFHWAVVSGVGISITYLGFYWLYIRYGASYYVLYAILSMLTTSIFVGVVVFHEPFNLYRWVSLLLAIASVVFFALGKPG